MWSATRWAVWFLLAFELVNAENSPRVLMYLTGQHNFVPSFDLASNISHVILAFMQSHVFNVDETPAKFPLFTTIKEVRSKFRPDAKVTVAIGGWGDSKGFEEGVRNETSRKRWTRQVKAMVDMTGADGVDIDWEYPGGNRDDYKLIPNSERVWEIEAYVSLLQELRSALGKDKIISVAVPGLERDLMAFTTSTIPRIIQEVDYLNVMTYDLMNRRDTVVKHHSGVANSLESVKRYMARGAAPHQLNLGLGYYVKAFLTGVCDPKHILGCPTQLLEDPKTGADLGKTAAFSWRDQVPSNLAASFKRAQTEGQYFGDGSYGYWDAAETRWWTYDTPPVITTKIKRILEPLRLGGIFAWGLGEDAPAFDHLKATIDGVAAIEYHDAVQRDEL